MKLALTLQQPKLSAMATHSSCEGASVLGSHMPGQNQGLYHCGRRREQILGETTVSATSTVLYK